MVRPTLLLEYVVYRFAQERFRLRGFVTLSRTQSTGSSKQVESTVIKRDYAVATFKGVILLLASSKSANDCAISFILRRAGNRLPLAALQAIGDDFRRDILGRYSSRLGNNAEGPEDSLGSPHNIQLRKVIRLQIGNFLGRQK